MTEFVELLTQTSAEELTSSVFKNKQRTSTKNGILKAEAVSLVAKVLVDSTIENFSDTEDETKTASAREGVVRIPGQGSGISFDYFLMLAGRDEAVKSDRMIRGFVELLRWNFQIS